MTAAALALAGCPKSPGASRVPTLEAADLFRPGRFDYEELTSVDGQAPTRDTVTEEWVEQPDVPPPAGFTGRVFAVDEFRTGLPPARTLWVSGDQGLGYFASVGPTGQEVRYAPKVTLPPTVHTGLSWTGTHGEGASANERTCHVEPTPYCPAAGAAVTCETHWTAGGAVWMRQHYCEGLGWVGYEALTVRNGVTTRAWSEEATFEGQPLPLVGIELRPFPEVEVHQR